MRGRGEGPGARCPTYCISTVEPGGQGCSLHSEAYSSQGGSHLVGLLVVVVVELVGVVVVLVGVDGSGGGGDMSHMVPLI